MYIAAKGKNKAVAQEYATNYFIQPEVAKALFDVQPRPPALQAVYDEVAASNPDIKAFVEAGADGQTMPSITAMAATFDPWGKAGAASSAAPTRRRPPSTGHHDQRNSAADAGRPGATVVAPGLPDLRVRSRASRLAAHVSTCRRRSCHCARAKERRGSAGSERSRTEDSTGTGLPGGLMRLPHEVAPPSASSSS